MIIKVTNERLVESSKRVTCDKNRGGVNSSFLYLLQKVYKLIKTSIDTFRCIGYNILNNMCDYVIGL